MAVETWRTTIPQFGGGRAAAELPLFHHTPHTQPIHLVFQITQEVVTVISQVEVVGVGARRGVA
ncbi:MAG: hypothetical protein FWD09_09425, partial [Lentimicrobiaceae bacterium]|nr:hypothetical protein [Lentimicrobiaceae bacterium]